VPQNNQKYHQSVVADDQGVDLKF